MATPLSTTAAARNASVSALVELCMVVSSQTEECQLLRQLRNILFTQTLSSDTGRHHREETIHSFDSILLCWP